MWTVWACEAKRIEWMTRARINEGGATPLTFAVRAEAATCG